MFGVAFPKPQPSKYRKSSEIPKKNWRTLGKPAELLLKSTFKKMMKSGSSESKYKNKLDIATDTVTQYWRYLVWNKLSIFHNISLVYKLCVPDSWIFKRALLFWKWQELLSLYKHCIAVTNSAGAKLLLNYDNTGFTVTSNKRNKKKTVIWWGKLNHTIRVNEAMFQSLVNFHHFSRSKKYKCILLPLLHVNPH